VPSDATMAPLWRRLMASLTDMIVWTLAGGAAIPAGFGAQGVYQRVRGRRRPSVAQQRRPCHGFQPSRAQQGVVWIASAGLAVLGRNWRGPGFRILHLRRVDVRTAGPVSVRSALVGEAFELASRAASDPLVGVHASRREAQLSTEAPSCLWPLVAGVLLRVVSEVCAPGGRTIRDRAAGTVVILE
jgi:hypothetical protein